MDSQRDSFADETVALRVRRNTGSAALAAVCLIYFGFFRGFSPPPVADLFSFGDALFNYTLRIGGVLMGLVALGSLTGVSIVLMLDAVVSVAIGLGLMLSGLSMMVGGQFTFNYMLYLLFGAMFLSAGVRNGHDFRVLTAWRPESSGRPDRPHRDTTVASTGPATSPAESSLAGELLQRGTHPREQDATTPRITNESIPSSDDSGSALRKTDVAEPSEQGPVSPRPSKTGGTRPRSPSVPDDGFLASFADDDPPSPP